MNRQSLCQELHQEFQKGMEKDASPPKQEKQFRQLEIDSLVSQYMLEILKGNRRCEAEERASGRIYCSKWV